MGEVIVIASGKGGTGKSMFAANMGAVLAGKDHKVILLDMAMGQGSLDLYLGLHDKVVYNAYDAASGMCRVRQATIKDQRFPCLHLMAAAPHANDGQVTRETMGELLAALKKQYDYIIIDGPAGMGPDLELAASGADKAVLVVTPDYASVRSAAALDTVLRDNGITEISCVMNKVKMNMMELGGCLSFDDVSKLLRTRVIGVINYDELTEASLYLGMPIVLDDRGYMKENFEKITRRVVRRAL